MVPQAQIHRATRPSSTWPGRRHPNTPRKIPRRCWLFPGYALEYQLDWSAVERFGRECDGAELTRGWLSAADDGRPAWVTSL